MSCRTFPKVTRSFWRNNLVGGSVENEGSENPHDMHEWIYIYIDSCFMFNFWNWGDTQLKAQVGKMQGHLDFTNKHVLGTQVWRTVSAYMKPSGCFCIPSERCWCRSFSYSAAAGICVYKISTYSPVSKHSNGKSTIWRCISYSRWGFSIAMFVYRRVIQNISFMQRNYMILHELRRWHLFEKTTPTFVEFIPTGQKTVTKLLQTSYVVTFRWLTINLLMVCSNSPHWLAGKHISCFKLNCRSCSKFELKFTLVSSFSQEFIPMKTNFFTKKTTKFITSWWFQSSSK